MTKLLIVDDNEQNLYMLQVLLGGYGYEVESATNGAEALKKARRDPPDMIITDILMPVMDGFSLCREWKKDERLKGIPFVFYTATYTDPKDEEFALTLGAERFIVKPVEPDVFVEMLREVIAEAEEGRLVAPREPIEEEPVYLKEYSERLVKKLEDKMLQLEEANRALKCEVSERVRAEEALRESEARYRLHFENVSDVIYSISPELTMIDVSPSVERVLGYKPEELIGRPFQVLNVLAPECLEQAFSDTMRVLGGERIASAVYQFIAQDGTRKWGEVSGAPVVRDGQVVAVISVARDITERKKAEEKLQRSYEQLQRALEGTIHTLAATVERRDPYTAGHQRHVTQLACAIAKEMGLPQEQTEGIRMAGLIHDLGKIGVPAEILSKPGRLSEIEYGLIKSHPQVGHNILEGVEFPWPVAEIVLQHHERMDGSGYPAGLSGEEIMLEARILGVADVVEAMVSHRPYRSARGLDEALDEISGNRGALYDPEVVDACLKLFTEKGFTFE